MTDADITQVPLTDGSRPTRFSAETDHASLLGVYGQDVETAARSAAAGIAQSSATAFEPHTALYLGVYADAPAALELVIIDGTSSAIDATTGLSSIWGRLVEESAALGLDVPDSERAGFQESMDAGVLIVQSLTTFEFDDTIEVVTPSRWWHHRGGGTIEVVAPSRWWHQPTSTKIAPENSVSSWRRCSSTDRRSTPMSQRHLGAHGERSTVAR